MEVKGKVLKIEVSDIPLQLRSVESEEKNAEEAAQGVIEEANETAEKIRRTALQAAERERTKAREETAALVKEAEEKRQATLEEAIAEGREEGRQTVLQELKPRLEAALDEFEQVVRKAEECWRGCFEEHKNEVVALAIEVAERIVRKVSAEDRELVRRTAEEALRLARDRQSITLRLNREDIEFLKEFEEELLNRFEDIQSFRVEVDERVDRGGVWVETASGFIDARIRNQLDELMESVLFEEENPWKRKEASRGEGDEARAEGEEEEVVEKERLEEGEDT